MIGRANAANVSIYPVDAVGLRIHSQEMANGIEINNAAKSSLNSPDGSNGAAMAAGIEITQAGSTSHVFGRLAKETGGFVIENTNDLAAGFRRIDADRRFHYLLTYMPRKAEFGGEYRRLEVKVARKGAVVRARSGYRADRSLAHRSRRWPTRPDRARHWRPRRCRPRFRSRPAPCGCRPRRLRVNSR